MEACRAVELAEAPEHVRRAARSRMDVEGLHALAEGYWLLCGPLQRTAGHRLRLVSAEVARHASARGAGEADAGSRGAERHARGGSHVRAVVQHERPAPGTPTAQVLTRPVLLLSVPPGLPLEVVLREPDGSERTYRAV